MRCYANFSFELKCCKEILLIFSFNKDTFFLFIRKLYHINFRVFTLKLVIVNINEIIIKKRIK